MKRLAVLAILTVSVTASAQEPLISFKFDGLTLEREIKSSCSEVLEARVVDDGESRRMAFRRGSVTVATMWSAPIHYHGWATTTNGWQVEMNAGHTESDVQALVACFAPFTLPTQPYGALVIHR